MAANLTESTCIICGTKFSKRIKLRYPRKGSSKIQAVARNRLTCSPLCSRLFQQYRYQRWFQPILNYSLDLRNKR